VLWCLFPKVIQKGSSLNKTNFVFLTIALDEPIEIIIHLYTEMSQGNALYSYLYLKQAKTSFFLFSSTNSKNRRAEMGGQ
jgi:hypothetical protein